MIPSGSWGWLWWPINPDGNRWGVSEGKVTEMFTKHRSGSSGAAAVAAPRTLIEAKGPGKVYGRGENRVGALAGVGLRIEGGAVADFSGSGKSTLMNLLDRPASGSYVFDGGREVSRLEGGKLTRARSDLIWASSGCSRPTARRARSPSKPSVVIRLTAACGGDTVPAAGRLREKTPAGRENTRKN